MILLLILLPACKVQKHMEMDKVTTTENKVDVVETTDKNTTRFIVITKYQNSMDSLGNYPVESVTEIKEVNNDKVVTETKGESKEQTEEHVTEDTKKGTDIKWYIVCFCAGIAVTLIVIGLIKLLIWYIRSKRGV